MTCEYKMCMIIYIYIYSNVRKFLKNLIYHVFCDCVIFLSMIIVCYTIANDITEVQSQIS